METWKENEEEMDLDFQEMETVEVLEHPSPPSPRWQRVLSFGEAERARFVPKREYHPILGTVEHTVIYGKAGTGKSTIAYGLLVEAAMKGKKVLFITTEDDPVVVVQRVRSLFPDADTSVLGRNVVLMDYTRFKPRFEKVKEQIRGALRQHQPDLVIVDSFSGIVKYEAEIRGELFDLMALVREYQTETRKPVRLVTIHQIRQPLGISRFRPAGGEAIPHLADRLLRTFTVSPDENSILYYAFVEKDKNMREEQYTYIRIQLTKNGLEVKRERPPARRTQTVEKPA